MSRSYGLPRFENPASVEVGDTVRVAWKVGQVEHTRTGKVHRVIESGPIYSYVTEDGNEIFRWVIGKPYTPRITLLSVEQSESAVALSGIEEIERMLTA